MADAEAATGVVGLIVQQAGVDGSRLVVTLEEHLRLAAQVLTFFGNAEFIVPPPQRLFASVVRHHDAGWRDEDKNVRFDGEDGLPMSLNKLPVSRLIEIGMSSIKLGLARHKWCGLLISMHVVGLYTGRYDTDARHTISLLSTDEQLLVNNFLQKERKRQAELVEELQRNSCTRRWVEVSALWSAYRLLQFFDSLSVWFCTRAPDGCDTWEFPALPHRNGQLVPIQIEGVHRCFTMCPWPFGRESMRLMLHGRRVVKIGPERWQVEGPVVQELELRTAS